MGMEVPPNPCWRGWYTSSDLLLCQCGRDVLLLVASGRSPGWRKELHNFVDDFVVGTYFDLGESLDSELGCNIVDSLWLACHHGGFVPHAVAST